MPPRKIQTSVVAFLLAFVCAVTALARPSSSAVVLPSQSDALAELNNRAITLDDIDPRVRELALRLDSEIESARNQILADQIDAILFEQEAARRRISINRLLAIEIGQRIVAPTAEKIQAIYDTNRTQFGTLDLNGARPQIVAYLKNESAQKLIVDFAARLRKRFVVVMVADVNSPKVTPATTLATVAGRAIAAGPLLERLKPIIYDLRLRVYEAVTAAVEQTIYDLLVLAEASRLDIGPEVIIRKEITEKYRVPNEDDIAKFYEENKARIMGDTSAMRPAIVSYLEQQERTRLENELSEKLRKGATIRVNLVEPEPPVLAINADDDPSRGQQNAPVTVVVFTDFQCPNCALNHPMIDEVTKSYGNNVRLVIRDFPLDMHENARKAAEAANAANAQGKFFEYIELLFKNQQALDVASLKKYASDLGLNRARFDAALSSGAYEQEVSHDVEDGKRYGILATPTVFVNGVRLNKLSPESLRAAIDRAIAKKKST
jgi:protein-disulfide isomerase